MHNLTPDERHLLNRRLAQFDEFFDELVPVLVEFIRLLELPDPHRVMTDAADYLPAVDLWVQRQVLKTDDEVWLLVRLTYFIGEYYIQRFGGIWFVQEDPKSPLFARYVVGGFTGLSRPNISFDPYDVAAVCLAEPPGRSLIEVLAGVDKELEEI